MLYILVRHGLIFGVTGIKVIYSQSAPGELSNTHRQIWFGVKIKINDFYDRGTVGHSGPHE